ncbi:hypothetical protein [Amycolatopsis sp. H20-H5]|uniref:hypothetical protein n=1 Tax=Amycolatopsis sp. H20-H5 TaxID=3046309 RepID=UPI002DBDEE99|nr:hypothetical protein [Amycolatopsis sp. H20-H5]MEC3981403.1 hypothetical protein [Amycolatopsis sp. H20-H5]
MPVFELREPSFELAELLGRPADEARRRCEEDGFFVQIVDLGRTDALTLDLRLDRIRLLTRHGKVERVSPG